MTKRFALYGSALAMAAMLVACGGDTEADMEEMETAVEETAAETMDAAEDGAEMAMDEMAEGAMSLEDAVSLEARTEQSRRDEFRNPVETLEFFGLESDMTVLEVYPGGGWYSSILEPYLAAGGGEMIAIFQDSERYADALTRYNEAYPDVDVVKLSTEGGAVGEPGSADMVLTFRNVHNMYMGDYAAEAFSQFYDVLKPGGVLGVVDHRLPEDADTELQRSSGYMKESVVIAFAEEAGFTLAAKSEINANPEDDADHPFGVWTLPPSSRTSGWDGSTVEDFNPEEYIAIGESDRMTLKFVKSEEPAEAMLE